MKSRLICSHTTSSYIDNRYKCQRDTKWFQSNVQNDKTAGTNVSIMKQLVKIWMTLDCQGKKAKYRR